MMDKQEEATCHRGRKEKKETCANHAVGSSPQSIHPGNERDLTAQEEEVEPITTEGV